MLSRLEGDLFKQLHTALVNAFQRPELELFVRTALDARLDEIAPDVAGFSDVCIALVSWAERRGRIPDLLDALVAERPTVPMFAHLRDDLSTRLKGGLPGPGKVNAAPPPTAFGPGARTAEPAAVVRWAEAMASAARGVCLVEVGDAPWTGFAIAPRLVLCPHQAVRPVLDGDRHPGEVRVTFGWQATTSNAPAIAGMWELDPEMPLVDHDADLGFALLLLGPPAPPGGSSMLAEQVAAMRGAAPVSPVAVSAARPDPNAQLFLLAQALGQPVEVETAFAVPGDDPNTLLYRTDGEDRAGRTGAPVFDARWHAIGLHLDAEQVAGGGQGKALALAPVLERPLVRVALAAGKPPPEPMLDHMAS